MLTIGICGASGSGKTTLAEELMARLPGRATLVHQDAYYKDHSHLPFEERARINYDHPEIFDHDLLYADLKALTEGRPIQEKGYDFAQHRRSDPLTTIVPGDVLIFEGIHAFYDVRIRELLDFKLFMKVDPDVCLLRRVQRDILERGREIDGIARQYLDTVKPMYEQYIRNYSEYADIIVAKGGKSQRIVDVLACYINSGRV
ncbi:MAG: uridine kinase [Clostridia bacterium]|nr:uridine kinase [Clostridia bacterium]